MHRSSDGGASRSSAVVSRCDHLVNPFGFGVWRYVKDLSTDPTIRDTITEWAPMSVSTFSGAAFFVTAAVIAGWLARGTRPVPWGALLWIGTFFLLALPARRGVIWWALVAPVVVASLLHLREDALLRPAREDQPGRSSRCSSVWSLLALPWWRNRTRTRTSLTEAPDADSHGPPPSFPPVRGCWSPQPWGSWFEFDSPHTPVFVDPRVELYPTDIWNDYYDRPNSGCGMARGILDRYGVEGVVVDRRTWAALHRRARKPIQGGTWCSKTPDGSLFVRVHSAYGSERRPSATPGRRR